MCAVWTVSSQPCALLIRFVSPRFLQVIEIIQKHTSPVATLRRALVRGVHRLGGWNRLLGLACVEVVGLGIITGLTMYKRSEKPPTMDDFI